MLLYLNHGTVAMSSSKDQIMNQTTQSLLQEIAQTGQAVIITSKPRETNSAYELTNAGICYISAVKDGYIIIKFGTRPVTI